MFEIIMLFAFLYAAICQLLPARSGATRSPLNQRGRPDKEETVASQGPAQKRRAIPEPLSKAIDRFHRYAHAA